MLPAIIQLDHVPCSLFLLLPPLAMLLTLFLTCSVPPTLKERIACVTSSPSSSSAVISTTLRSPSLAFAPRHACAQSATEHASSYMQQPISLPSPLRSPVSAPASSLRRDPNHLQTWATEPSSASWTAPHLRKGQIRRARMYQSAAAHESLSSYS